MQWNTAVGPNAIEHSGRVKHGVTPECSGVLDQVGTAEYVQNDNGETALWLMWRTVVHRKVPSTVIHGEEAAAAPLHQL